MAAVDKALLDNLQISHHSAV